MPQVFPQVGPFGVPPAGKPDVLPCDGVLQAVFALQGVVPADLAPDAPGGVLFDHRFVDGQLQFAAVLQASLDPQGVPAFDILAEKAVLLARTRIFFHRTAGGQDGQRDGRQQDLPAVHDFGALAVCPGASRIRQAVLAQPSASSWRRISWISSSMLYSLRDSSLISARLAFRSSCILSIWA